VAVRPNSKAAVRKGFERFGRDLEMALYYVRQGYNLALLMGPTQTEPMMVFDQDGDTPEVQKLMEQYDIRSPMEVETAGGGLHVYLQLPQGVSDVRSRIKWLGLPIDLKLTGYCLISGEVEGKAYQVRGQIVPAGQLPVFPRELLDRAPLLDGEG